MQGPRAAEDPQAEELRLCSKAKQNLVEGLRILPYAPSLHGLVRRTSYRLPHPTQHSWL